MREFELATYNLDIRIFYTKINRYIFEAYKCNSANAAFVSDHDTGRLHSYLDDLTGHLDYATADPIPDLVETAPHKIDLAPPAEIKEIENEAMLQIIFLFEALRGEVVGSQSSRLPVGYLEFDSKRAYDLIEKIRNFLVDYVADLLPIDRPKSSPMAAMSGTGRTGVTVKKA